MRNFVKLMTLAFLGFFVEVTFATSSPTSSNGEVPVSVLMQEEQRIEAELYRLKKELKRRSNKKDAQSTASDQKQKGKNESDLFKVSPTVKRDVYNSALNYISGITVTTSPILGLKSAWNASDLLYQVSSMNEDLLLLQERDRFNGLLERYSGDSLDMRPLLVISGGIETRASYSKNYTDTDDASVNLSTAEIDLWAIMSQWASGFMAIDYDDSPPDTGSRVTNSRLFLQRGFVTIGNLQQSPVYMTMGQLFVPFGRYSSAVVTTPLTKTIGRIEDRALVMGYFNDGIYFQAYGDNGNRVDGSGDGVIFQGGANLGYKNNHSTIGGIDVGVGYTTNLADSQGMQSNGLSSDGNPSTQFAGFGKTTNADGTSANQLAHNVDALDFHLSLSRGMITLITEYITALRRFDEGDLSFNGEGAAVSALQTELDFNFVFHGMPLTVGGAYNRSWQALALNVPQESYFAVVSTSFWKNTVESLEFRHDVNYSVTIDTGGGGAGDESLDLPVTDANVGGSRDQITFQLGAYF